MKMLDAAGLAHFWGLIVKQIQGRVAVVNDKRADEEGRVTLTAQDVSAYPAGGIRAMAVTIPVLAWAGEGPYHVTIPRADVTPHTCVALSLSGGSADYLTETIEWSTEAGCITLATAVPPGGELTGMMILMETEEMEVTG